MKEQLALLPGYLSAHLQLTLFSLLAGLLISVPTGILLSRSRRLEHLVLGVASVIQTIPSLALLAVMVPALAAVGVTSIGFLPAFLGLSLYSMLPILRNTVTGLAGIDPAMREAARGVGMTSTQQLVRVELPLAMPVILAGVRLATVWTVGIATLSTPVGATSLGNYIFTGLQTRNSNAVLVGCVAAAGLALSLDGLVRLLGTAVIARKRGLLAVSAGAFLILFGYAAASLVTGFSRTDATRLIIGGKTFTEQYILSRILAGRVEAHTGRRVDVVTSLGSTVAFDALRSGDIDAYVDYSGTIWATVMRQDGAPPDRTRLLAEVSAFLRERHRIEVVGPLGFENTYALVMRTQQARALGIERIGDLAPRAPGLTIAGSFEFFGRPEWRMLQDVYGLAFAQRLAMEPALMYEAVATRQVDVVSAFSTDGRIAAFDLTVLEEERRAIPPYDAVVLVSGRVTRERPDVMASLRTLIGAIDAASMRRMNLAVDRDGASPAAVAERFLAGLGP